MSKNVRGFKWLVSGLVGVSMLGACGAPGEGEDTSAQIAEQAAGEVEVSLSVGSTSLRAHEDVAVTVTYTNRSSEPVQLLRWFVAGQQSIPEGLFEVYRDGQEVEYRGPHIKRMEPRAQDFIVLQPGQSVSGQAALSGLYDLSASGTYSVRFAAQSPHLGPNVALTRSAQLDSGYVNLFIEGRPNSQPEYQAQGTVSAMGVTAASNCSSTRASQIATAFSSASSYASSTSSYLNGISSGTTRYTTWFGAYSSTNLNTARSHFTAIKNAFASAAVTVDCSCTDSGTYAYVYPASPYKIYVCGAFWSASNTGTDSRAGTLVHEMSHFNIIAATDDHAYGQTNAKNLAKSSPTKALDNADNHEYISENTPSLQSVRTEQREVERRGRRRSRFSFLGAAPPGAPGWESRLPMTRGPVGWIALCCLSLVGGGCSSRPATPPQTPPPTAEQKPAEPAPAPKEEQTVATTLECALSVPATVRAGDAVELTFRLTNRTQKPLWVLNWRTPLEGRPTGNDFRVTRDGTELPYQGPMAKRGDPSAESYVAVAPGASVDGRLDLSLAYGVKAPGRYRIEFQRELMDVAEAQADVPRTLDTLKPLAVRCPAVETTLTAP